MELLQLIREAKYPDRMGIEIPESAKIVLFQEEKLKSYYNELSGPRRNTRPHFNDMEFKLRSGMDSSASSNS